MKTLNPYDIPLESINLIEASAGTGKSWTVTLLYLRLLLEKNLTVDQILVVTFTEAATKELRDNIRTRLLEALDAFQDDSYAEDNEYLILKSQCDDNEKAIHALMQAKVSLDEAAIFTIHGFCQRTLNENAFEAGLPFETELLEDDSALMQKITDDFWRRRFYTAPKALISKIIQKNLTPDSLLGDIRNHVGKPYLKICGPDSIEQKSEQWHTLQTLFTKVKASWITHKEDIHALYFDTKYDASFYVDIPRNRDDIFSEMNKVCWLEDVPHDLDVKKLSWLGDRPKVKKTAKYDDIQHTFFQEWQKFLDLWLEVDNSSDDLLNTIRIELLETLRKELPSVKRELGVLSFDDLLLQMQQALQNYEPLAGQLRNKYRAALIDEFQDTDPIQYDIFSRIYNKSSVHNAVFFVGDPKQAIYSFRGGDIQTYLKAKSDTHIDNRFTLNTNWRSQENLIHAYNCMYSQSNNPFKDAGIDYVQVKAGKAKQAIQLPLAKAPLQFWHYPSIEDPKSVSADTIKDTIANAVAGEIASLLNAAKDNKAKIAEKAISGDDIAILVRSHAQGNIIKEALNSRGIVSVQSSKLSIFETYEAQEMWYLLKAILEPQNEPLVRRALVIELIGYRAPDLLALQDDHAAWEKLLENFQNWHIDWRSKGFLPMFRMLMQTMDMHQHLLSFIDGDRRLTNILHLAELIHQTAREHDFSPQKVTAWLKHKRDEASDSEAELRLESDDNAVKIVTIHKSKGLEYPIVYCPFVGISSDNKSTKVFSFQKDGKTYLEIGSSDSDEHKALKKAEDRAEDTRLLYVALTRAEYQCTVTVFPEAISGKPDHSALGWLLSRGLVIPSGNSKAAKAQKTEFFEQYNATLNGLVEIGHGDIGLMELPTYPADLRYTPPQTNEELSARTFTANIRNLNQITSFSGLTAGVHAEKPDHDSQQLFIHQTPIKNDDNEFPRGALAGTALHEIYENIDFTLSVEEQHTVFENVLETYNFDEKYLPIAKNLIQESLNAELALDLSLTKITNKSRLNEMAFYMPLERLDTEKFKQILYQHLPKNDVHWQVIRDAVDNLYFDEVEGFLKGFIDLIFEYNGQYYVADYKSNSLPDYGTASLYEAMAHSHYYLQYLLYSVALHRFLENRIDDYEWDKHVGGVYYLFIRGMKADKKSLKNPGGVFFDKPSRELIEALDGLFTRIPTQTAVGSNA